MSCDHKNSTAKGSFGFVTKIETNMTENKVTHIKIVYIWKEKCILIAKSCIP